MNTLKTISGKAMLPLYDWPEFHSCTDFIWSRIREAARGEGLDLPVALDHRYQRVSAWMSDDLIFSQLCGSPWHRKYRQTARYLASCHFDLPGAAPGHYFSKIVVAASSPWQGLDQVATRRLAFNDDDSQSGVHCLRPLMDVEPLVANGVVTGGHRFSMEAVAEGRAEFAAIDAFSFTLATKVMPDLVGQLRVIDTTPQRPAPLLITALALGVDVGASLRRAVLQGLADLPAEITEGYSFLGAVDLGTEPYEIFTL